MTAFEHDTELASERVGGVVLAANDDFFAAKENLIKDEAPAFDPGAYTDRGKLMDGWETRRRREPGYDWCVLQLGLPGVLSGVVVDTAYFKGNYPEACSVELCDAPDGNWQEASWREALPRSPLRGDARHPLAVSDGGRATHVRLNIYPDGGVARLRVYGRVDVDWERVLAGGDAIDLAALEHGGAVIATSDDFFGSRRNLILPGPSRGMFDGWETRRRRGPGNDWAMVRLGRPGTLERVVIDTSHFKGNAPGWCSVEVCADADPAAAGARWHTALPKQAVSPHAVHEFAAEVTDHPVARFARLSIYPDGGVARLRLFGRCD